MHPHISARLYQDVWLIRPETHHALADAYQAYLAGKVLPFAPKIEEVLKPVQIQDGYARLRVAGILGKHLSTLEMMCAGGYDVARLEQEARALIARPDVHTVLLSLHSPGGQASGIEEAVGVLQELAARKRLVAYVDHEACSAAYWLATAASEIYAAPSSIVGSISAYIALIDQSRRYEMRGLRLERFRDGALKGMGMAGSALTDDERAFLQARVEASGAAFKSAVRAARPGVDPSLLDGRWFSGREALEAGLVDGLHSSQDSLLEHLIDTRRPGSSLMPASATPLTRS